MRHVEIVLPPDVADGDALRAIDRAIAQAKLTATLRGSLKKYPGCTHWHAKLGRQPGTLEVTYWPAKRRAWFSVQDGRVAPWIEGAIREVAAALKSSWATFDPSP